jgi:hypothetical protein
VISHSYLSSGILKLTEDDKNLLVLISATTSSSITNLASIFQSPFIPRALSCPEKSINLAPILNLPSSQLGVKVGDLPIIFDFTHPTSLPLSVEPGLGRVMVVARVQTVVPLCKISVPDGSVKATCQSLSSNMLR